MQYHDITQLLQPHDSVTAAYTIDQHMLHIIMLQSRNNNQNLPPHQRTNQSYHASSHHSPKIKCLFPGMWGCPPKQSCTPRQADQPSHANQPRRRPASHSSRQSQPRHLNHPRHQRQPSQPCQWITYIGRLSMHSIIDHAQRRQIFTRTRPSAR